jgi:hypothetical protein
LASTEVSISSGIIQVKLIIEEDSFNMVNEEFMRGLLRDRVNGKYV